MKLTAHIPNLLTLLNLLSGVIGIIWVLEGEVLYGAYFVLISAGFDFFDGFAARLLKVQSLLGKELDSLSDVVSFGVLPGVIIFSLIEKQSSNPWLPYLGLIIPLLSAYRLAKFNLDTRQGDKFIGLPTPANALFLSSIPHLAQTFQEASFLQEPLLLLGTAWTCSLLLISELPLIALKFKSFSFSETKYIYFILASAVALVGWLQLAGIPLVILLYILVSLVQRALDPK
ncbi:MAG: CDP-diacylglycerol--serine O-phosphatidyltransferase [Cyclobacteriaceae bacterium]|nr:CDP-diacylglycerol--serine O-phosphatidyltransferase [Cyclobacteriaceae bacterium]